MPRYSATSGVENPAVNTPSTSERLSPASSSAFSAASACSWIADRSGTWPIRSDSAAPTIATRPEIGSDIAGPPVEDAVGQLGELVVAHRQKPLAEPAGRRRLEQPPAAERAREPLGDLLRPPAPPTAQRAHEARHL